MSAATGLVENLSQVLTHLQDHPFPHVPNPPSCSKRASVALIIRIRSDASIINFHAHKSHLDKENTQNSPCRQHSARDGGDGEDSKECNTLCLSNFFAQRWVQDGDPEVLFIKRAGRKGDRWSGHLAFPGGGRDAEDGDDRATAIRETREEIGLELTPERAISVGNLAERVVTTTWGTRP